MSKLAVYDKNQAESDKKKLSYFRNDYVYRKNMWIRFNVLIGCLIVILFHTMHKIVIDNVDLMTGFDYKAEFINAAVFTVVIMAAYSCIGTMIYISDYQKAKKRLRRYYKLMDELDKIDKKNTKPVGYISEIQGNPVRNNMPERYRPVRQK